MPSASLDAYSRVLASALLTLSTVAAHAQSSPAAPNTSIHGLQFELGLTAYQETYKEEVGGSRVMQEKANMAGIQGRLTMAIDPQWLARLGAEYARGESKYTGAFQGSSYGSLQASGIDREKLQVQAEVVFMPATWQGSALSAGLLARRLTDDLHQIPGGYERVNTSYFATLGAEHRFALSSTWQVTPALRYLHLIDGTQKADLDGGLRLKQNRGHGIDVSATFQQVRADGSGMTVRPFWRQLRISASDAVTAPSGTRYVEPKNTTQEIGLDLGWVF